MKKNRSVKGSADPKKIIELVLREKGGVSRAQIFSAERNRLQYISKMVQDKINPLVNGHKGNKNNLIPQHPVTFLQQTIKP